MHERDRQTNKHTIANKRFVNVIDVTVLWSVCLSACHIRAHDSSISFSDLFQNLTDIGQPIPVQILPQSDPLPVDLSDGDIR